MGRLLLFLGGGGLLFASMSTGDRGSMPVLGILLLLAACRPTSRSEATPAWDVTCSRCNGRGETWYLRGEHTVFDKCPACGGSGKL